MTPRHLILFVHTLLLLHFIDGRLDSVIDVDDILSVEFMPSSILMLENPEQNLQNLQNLNETVQPLFSNTSHTEGKIGDAFTTMGYHRKMMNEYLCRNFIAEQIVEDMSTTRIKRRLGKPDVTFPSPTEKPKKLTGMKETLLEDEGSTQYKNWLTRSTTLEDIYKHYENVQDRSNEDDDDKPEEEEDYDRETEYAYQQPQVPVGPAKSSHSGPALVGVTYAHPGYGYVPQPPHAHINYGYTGQGAAPYGVTHPAATAGAGVGHTAFEDVAPQHYHVHDYSPKYHHSGGGGGGGKDLSELFEIALTALAYLSFGMFIVHVVMCLSTVSCLHLYTYADYIAITETVKSVPARDELTPLK